ncbi:hypothetical protein ACWE42_11170 [Sutcliffiella cohnii]
MSVYTYLNLLASYLLLSSTENSKIITYISTLSISLNNYFDKGEIHKHFHFGSNIYYEVAIDNGKERVFDQSAKVFNSDDSPRVFIRLIFKESLKNQVRILLGIPTELEEPLC